MGECNTILSACTKALSKVLHSPIYMCMCIKYIFCLNGVFAQNGYRIPYIARLCQKLFVNDTSSQGEKINAVKT